MVVPTSRDKPKALFDKLADVNDKLERGLDILLRNAAKVAKTGPNTAFGVIKEWIGQVVRAVPGLIIILGNNGLTQPEAVEWFEMTMKDYEYVHQTTGKVAVELESLQNNILRSSNAPSSSPHFSVMIETIGRLKVLLSSMHMMIWDVLKLHFQEEGMQMIATNWNLKKVAMPDTTAAMTQQQKQQRRQQIAEYLETAKQKLQEDMRNAIANGLRGADGRKAALNMVDKEQTAFLQRFGDDQLPEWQSQFSELTKALEEEQRALDAWTTFAAKEVPDEEAELERFLQKLDALLSLLADRTRAGLQNAIECAQILTEARDTAQEKFPTRLSKIDAELASMRWPLIVGITATLPSSEDASALFYRMMAQKDQIDDAFEDVFKMVRRIDAASPVALLEQQAFIDLGALMHKIVHGTPNTIAFLMQTGPSEDAITERFVKSVPDLIDTGRACVRAANNLRALGQTLADHLMTHVETLDEDEQALLEAAAKATGASPRASPESATITPSF